MSRQIFSSSESEYDDDDVVILSPQQATNTTTNTRAFTATNTTTAFTSIATNTASDANTAYSNFCDALTDTVSQRIQKRKLGPNDNTDYEKLKKKHKKLKEQNKKFREELDSSHRLITDLQNQITQLKNDFDTHTSLANLQNQSFLETMTQVAQYVQAMRINSMCKQYKRRAFNEEPAEEQANTALAASMNFFEDEIKNSPGFHENTNGEKISTIQGWCKETLFELQSWEADQFNRVYDPEQQFKNPFMYKVVPPPQEQGNQ